MIDLFNRSANKAAADRASEANDKQLAPARLAEISELFPIGQRLGFYPEYREDCRLESIIVGYLVNRHFVHHPQDVGFEASRGKTLMHVGQGPIRHRINQVQQFAFLLPQETDSLNRLDINRRAELQRTGIFRPGNAITLVSAHTRHGTPSIDTTVRRLVTLKGGLYANLAVAVLDVEENSLSHAELRRHHRLYTHIPVTLHTPNGNQKHQASLRDFSEDCARISFDPGNPLAHIAQLGRRLVLDLPLPESRQYHIIEGTVIKLDGDSLVMRLENLLANGQRSPIGMIDLLSIKGTLAAHPASQPGRDD